MRSHHPWSATPAAHECTGEPDDVVSLEGEPHSVREFPWTDAQGCLVRLDVLLEWAGSAHCGRQTVRVLRTGEPVGARWDHPWRSGDGSEYVRDPDQAYGQPELRAGFAELQELPPDAIDTGFRSVGRELWLSPSDPNAVYLRDSEGVERWPRGVVPLCA
ncbi:MAG: hypothetical protein WD184_05725 [Acidimicrobiia bacterium]